jgi:hypothetical protein
MLADWLDYVFVHPFDRSWEGSSEQIATFIAETFEHSGELLARFSDEQLSEGLHFILDAGGSEFMFSIVDSAVPAALRFRALRSFVPLFEQVMAAKCSPHLLHRDEQGAKPLNGVCYMWWDILPIHGRPEEPGRAEFDAEVLVVLRRLLAIPHDACRESALHGIGHWAIYYPSVANIVDEFLASTSGLRPELVSYALGARTGGVL